MIFESAHGRDDDDGQDSRLGMMMMMVVMTMIRMNRMIRIMMMMMISMIRMIRMLMIEIRMLAAVVESSSSSETEEEEHLDLDEHSAKDSGFRSQALDCSDQTLGRHSLGHGFDLIVVIMRMIVVIEIMI